MLRPNRFLGWLTTFRDAVRSAFAVFRRASPVRAIVHRFHPMLSSVAIVRGAGERVGYGNDRLPGRPQPDDRSQWG